MTRPQQAWSDAAANKLTKHYKSVHGQRQDPIAGGSG